MSKGGLILVKNPTFSIVEDLNISIGDISDLTKVSPRQLRYWEEKGYIHPKKCSRESKQRKYSLYTLIKVFHVKQFLDEGFTLKVAVKKAEEKKQKRMAIGSFFKERAEVEVITLADQSYQIDFGLSDDGGYQVLGIVNPTGVRLKVLPKQEN